MSASGLRNSLPFTMQDRAAPNAALDIAAISLHLAVVKAFDQSVEQQINAQAVCRHAAKVTSHGLGQWTLLTCHVASFMSNCQRICLGEQFGVEACTTI